ncbi:MAG: adenylate/guanylate cyclase domain-containing protein [Deltaproteobacteria bacterium]|nr:adenylate/guanylate cyclase domain-containing protein [Deltaproteobacteria bacterium]
MESMPKTRYAKSGKVHIAYQVVGDGPLDLVFVLGWVSHVELVWENPAAARFLRRLASFSRLILFDKPGTGLSDSVSVDQLPTLEQRMDDVRAVMDAAGSASAALLGTSEGGPMALLFAATHPARTTALILLSTYGRVSWAPDYPSGIAPEVRDKLFELVERGWGEGVVLSTLAPSHKNDPQLRQWWANFQRNAASPGAAVALLRMGFETDVRAVLPVITTPTLILQRSADRMVPAEQGRYLAEHIRGARHVELPGDDHLWYLGDSETLLEEIEVFLTGERHAHEPDRILATILFTDIVGSTEQAAQWGDRTWRELLEGYYQSARRELERFRGREIDTAGDGLFASFDGPARAVRCAEAIGAAVRLLGMEIRAGLHTGECEVIGDKLGGIAVHIGARIASQAGPGEVLVSSTVKDLTAGSGLRFEDRGAHVLKGVPGEWRLFAVAAAV